MTVITFDMKILWVFTTWWFSYFIHPTFYYFTLVSLIQIYNKDWCARNTEWFSLWPSSIVYDLLLLILWPFKFYEFILVFIILWACRHRARKQPTWPETHESQDRIECKHHSLLSLKWECNSVNMNMLFYST